MSADRKNMRHSGRGICHPLSAMLACVCSLVWPLSNTYGQESKQATGIDLANIPIESLIKIEIPTVTGASKIPQLTTQAPASVTVITAEEVQRYGYRTLADILQSVRGAHVSYDRDYSSLGLRGLSLGGIGSLNSRILLLVDGHRVNSNITDSGFIGTEFILDVDLIEQVEIIRGPGSVLYGNNAFIGVINVQTKRARDLNGVEASFEAGSFDTYKGRVTVGYGDKEKKGWEVLLSGSVYDSAGPERLPYTESTGSPFATNRVVQNVDVNDDRYKSLFGSIAVKDFTLEAGFVARDKRDPTGVYFSMLDNPKTQTSDERSFLVLKYAHEFPYEVDVAVQVYYDRYDFDATFPRDISSFAAAAEFKDDIFSQRALSGRQALWNWAARGEWWGGEAQITKRLFDVHTIALGVEYRDNFQQALDFTWALPRDLPDQVLRDIQGKFAVKRTGRQTEDYGLYFQSDFAVRTNLHLNAGARYDQYGSEDPTANPRIALIFTPRKGSTIKAIYGSAFRAPTLFELARSESLLNPETITTYELAYEQDIGQHLRSSISGFYNSIDDLITSDEPPKASLFRNIRRTEIKGVELELEAKWPELIGRLSYTFQESENLETGHVLDDSPHHLAKVSLSTPLVREKLFAGLEFQFTGKRSVGFTGKQEETDGFETVNFTLLSKNLFKGLEASASIYNLFDKHYSDPATLGHFHQSLIEREGRTFRVKLTYRF